MAVAVVASWMPCGIVVHDISPIDDSEQNVLNSSDLYLMSTPSPTGVPSGFRILPLTWLVGCSLSVKSSVVVGSGIVASRAIGSALNWPAARMVKAPGHSPLTAKAPVPKLVVDDAEILDVLEIDADAAAGDDDLIAGNTNARLDRGVAGVDHHSGHAAAVAAAERQIRLDRLAVELDRDVRQVAVAEVALERREAVRA